MGRGKATKSLELIEACVHILEEIQPCSVRAVCYQLFTRRLLASMAKSETNKVGRLLTYAREQGRIPWEWIVDETRAAERAQTWANPAAFTRAVVAARRSDRWQDQPVKVEVWSEKGTVRGTLAPILDEYAVTFRVMHGYSSATVIHQVAAETAGMSNPLVVLYVGDWDPSGLHMSQVDLPRRLAGYGARVDMTRVALTPELILRNQLPSFPLEDKRKDPRHDWYRDYQRQPGGFASDRCWELDALYPVLLRNTVEYLIRHCIDFESWDRYARVEEVEHASLIETLAGWPAAIAARMHA